MAAGRLQAEQAERAHRPLDDLGRLQVEGLVRMNGGGREGRPGAGYSLPERMCLPGGMPVHRSQQHGQRQERRPKGAEGSGAVSARDRLHELFKSYQTPGP